MTHEDYKELLPASALSALYARDHAPMEDHLSGCAQCRAELDAWQATASLLAYATKPLEPSPRLRARILENIRAQSPSTPDNVIQLPHRSKRPSFFPLATIAAALIFVALAVGVAILWQQNRTSRKEVTRLASQIEESRRQLDQENEALDLLMGSGTRMTELAGTIEAPGAHAMLAFDRKTGRAILMAKGLPAAPAGRAYQLWFMVGTKPMPGKVFTTDSGGNAMLHDQVPAEALNSTVFAVTLEKQSGEPAPKGPMFLLSGSRVSL